VSDELPPALRGLRERLREAAERDVEVEARVKQRLRRGRRRRALVVVAAALAAFGSVAVAERLIEREGEQLQPDPQDLPASIVEAAQGGVIASGAAGDPAGGPPWALRVFANAKGVECVALGRLRGGRLGRYDARTRTFHALPPEAGGTCEPLAERGMLVAVRTDAQPQPRTIVYGLVRDRRQVRVTIGGVARTLKPGALGSFIDVRSGVLDLAGATVSTLVDGRTKTRRLG
jgi:hypothetical protein